MADIQQLRDFLTVYNTLTEKCFQSCVRSYNSHFLDGGEEQCVSECIDKYMRVNRRLMLVFADYAPKVLFKQGQQSASEAITQPAAPVVEPPAPVAESPAPVAESPSSS